MLAKISRICTLVVQRNLGPQPKDQELSTAATHVPFGHPETMKRPVTRRVGKALSCPPNCLKHRETVGAEMQCPSCQALRVSGPEEPFSHSDYDGDMLYDPAPSDSEGR
jgi:hypothetical protein